jgi:hypothetical protein
LVIHGGGDALEYLIAWRWGVPRAASLIWQSGPDAAFWRDLGIGALLGVAAVLAGRGLTRKEALVIARPSQ